MGTTFLVTGAASGTERATAIALAANGSSAAVETFAEDSHNVQDVVDIIRASGGDAISAEADVRNSIGMEQACQTTVERFGRFDGAVANAGRLQIAPLDATTASSLHGPDSDTIGSTDELRHSVVDVDLTGVMRTVRAAARYLPRAGAIVCVSSIAGGAVGWAGHTPYTAAKAGVVGIRNAALELAVRGIRVNPVLPGVIETPQSLYAVNSGGVEGLEPLKAQIPLRRANIPAAVADVVAFLLFNASRYVTGRAGPRQSQPAAL